MTAEQAATLKRLAKAAYELDAFKPNLTRAEADLRIAALSAKLRPSPASAIAASAMPLPVCPTATVTPPPSATSAATK
jgi:hypothetical protein